MNSGEASGEIALRPLLLAAALCAAATLPLAWMARQSISSDGLAYLEVASNAARLGAKHLFTNAYWSPGYPALLAIVLKIFRPAPASDLAVVQAVDWTICAATYFAFTYFLYNFLRSIGVSSQAFIAFCYTLLFIANADQSLWLGGPNVMMEGSVYLAAGAALRLSLPRVRSIHYVAFGLALALAYVIKAALFPLSLALLAILFLWPGRKGIALAAVAFFIGVLPFVAYLSSAKGRLTFGDAGRLNFAWYVNNIPRSALWTNGMPASDALAHPPERISTHPDILKFDLPDGVESAYPYWYDPSYWYDGLRSHFSVRDQIQQFLRSFGLAPKIMLSGSNAFQLAARWLPNFAGLAAFVILGARFRNIGAALGRRFWLLLWPAVALGAFAAVLIEYRYVVPFAVIAWTALFAAACAVTKLDFSRAILWTVTAGLALAYLPDIALNVVHARKLTDKDKIAAARAAGMGIRPGDRIATLGFPVDTFWARIAGVSVSVEINDRGPEQIASLPDSDVRRILETLKAHGARALISSWRPAFDNDAGWVRLTQNTWIRLLE